MAQVEICGKGHFGTDIGIGANGHWKQWALGENKHQGKIRTNGHFGANEYFWNEWACWGLEQMEIWENVHFGEIGTLGSMGIGANGHWALIGTLGKMGTGRNGNRETWVSICTKYLFSPSANLRQVLIYIGAHLPRVPILPCAHLYGVPICPGSRML